MIADDAIVVRGLFARWIEAEPDMALVASLRNGREAVEQIERIKPDVVILDVDMPELDGITALPQLLAKCPGVTVIMASTLTRRNAEISLRALSLGATDYIPKPSSQSDVNAAPDFRRDLIEKIRQLGRRGHKATGLTHIADAPPLAPHTAPQARALHHYHPPHTPITLRPLPAVAPRVLLIEEHAEIALALTGTLERRGMQVARAASDADAPEHVELALADRAEERGDLEIRRHVPHRDAHAGRVEALEQGDRDRVVDGAQTDERERLLFRVPLIKERERVALDDLREGVFERVGERAPRRQPVRAEREEAAAFG